PYARLLTAQPSTPDPGATCLRPDAARRRPSGAENPAIAREPAPERWRRPDRWGATVRWGHAVRTRQGPHRGTGGGAARPRRADARRGDPRRHRGPHRPALPRGDRAADPRDGLLL